MMWATLRLEEWDNALEPAPDNPFARLIPVNISPPDGGLGFIHVFGTREAALAWVDGDEGLIWELHKREPEMEDRKEEQGSELT